MNIPEEVIALPSCPLKGKRSVPAISGVYFIEEDEIIVYVGLARDMKARVAHHASYSCWENAKVRWMLCSEKDMLSTELHYLQLLQPCGNTVNVAPDKFEFFCCRCRAHWNRRDPLSTHVPIACPRCKNTRWQTPKRGANPLASPAQSSS